jgi:hypothetical protein
LKETTSLESKITQGISVKNIVGLDTLQEEENGDSDNNAYSGKDGDEDGTDERSVDNYNSDEKMKGKLRFDS